MPSATCASRVRRDQHPDDVAAVDDHRAAVRALTHRARDVCDAVTGGDRNWGFGCRFYDRLRTRIRRLSTQLSWLRIVEKSMHFVFTVGAVPVRFYRGVSRRAKTGYLNRRQAELREQQLAFGVVAKELDWVFRIAIEARCEDAQPRIVLVKQEIGSGYSEEVFEVLLTNAPPKLVVPVPSFRKPAVPIAPPVVSPKRTAKKKRSTDDEGA